MSTCGAQTARFFADLAVHRKVWTIRDESGHPAPMSETGKRTMPFWSTKSRALKIVESVPAYEGFEVVEIDLADWRANWLPGLAEDGLLVGINWSGPRAKGYDLEPSSVAKRLAAALAATSSP